MPVRSLQAKAIVLFDAVRKHLAALGIQAARVSVHELPSDKHVLDALDAALSAASEELASAALRRQEDASQLRRANTAFAHEFFSNVNGCYNQDAGGGKCKKHSITPCFPRVDFVSACARFPSEDDDGARELCDVEAAMSRLAEPAEDSDDADSAEDSDSAEDDDDAEVIAVAAAASGASATFLYDAVVASQTRGLDRARERYETRSMRVRLRAAASRRCMYTWLSHEANALLRAQDALVAFKDSVRDYFAED